MSNKKLKLTIEDPFDTIPDAAMANVCEDGLIPQGKKSVPLDLRDSDLRQQICCVLEFLSIYAWIPSYKHRRWQSLGLQHHAEDYARKTKIGDNICHGAIIVACRLAQIPEFNSCQLLCGRYCTTFKLSLTYDLVRPYVFPTANGEYNWKNKPTKEFVSMVLTSSLDCYLIDNSIRVIASYLDIPFQPPPAYRSHARIMYHRLKHFASQT